MSIDPQQHKEQAPGQPSSPVDRNDPAIEQPAPDTGSPVDQSQSQSQTSGEQTQKSNGSAYVPDYEPEEKPETQRNLQPTKGHDADIDTGTG
jgi:hypothetical protein